MPPPPPPPPQPEFTRPAPQPIYSRPPPPMPTYSEPQFRTDFSSKHTKRENEAINTSIDAVGQVEVQPSLPLEVNAAASDDNFTIGGQDWS